MWKVFICKSLPFDKVSDFFLKMWTVQCLLQKFVSRKRNILSGGRQIIGKKYLWVGRKISKIKYRNGFVCTDTWCKFFLLRTSIKRGIFNYCFWRKGIKQSRLWITFIIIKDPLELSSMKYVYLELHAKLNSSV